ncbi:hypothetical protein ACO0RG_000544 [Hanseniaspora osmophila]
MATPHTPAILAEPDTPSLSNNGQPASTQDTIDNDLLPPLSKVNSVSSMNPSAHLSASIEPIIYENGISSPDSTGNVGEISHGLLKVPKQKGSRSSSRLSFDSIGGGSVAGRRSFDFMSSQRSSMEYYNSYAYGGNSERRDNGYGIPAHSGSMEYSPLGNNSIYEVVMNTRRKDWLTRPTTEDIPPVKLSSDETNKVLNSGRPWLKEIEGYVAMIQAEFSKYEELSMEFEGVQDNQERSSALSLENVGKQKKTLQDIPQVFADKNFKLDNQRVFNKIVKFDFQQYEPILANLTGELSDYLQIVESQLLDEISKKSDNFFQVLKDLDYVKEDITALQTELHNLNCKLKLIQRDEIAKKQQQIENKIKLSNCIRLETELKEVQKLIEEINKIKECYHKETADFSHCLQNIYQLELHFFEEKCFDKIDGLQEYIELLMNLKLEIAGKISLSFIQLLLDDLANYRSQYELVQILKILQNESKWLNFQIDDDFKTQLAFKINELNNCDELISTYKLYQDKIIHKIKTLVKSELPQITPEKNPNAKLSVLIMEQTPVEFLNMLSKVFTESTTMFKRLYEQQKVLLDLGLKEFLSNESEVAKSGSKDNKKNSGIDNGTESSDIFIQLDIRNGINESVRIVQLRMAKIINVRKDINSSLRVDHFLQLHNMMTFFIKQCEILTGEMLTRNLNDVVVTQTGLYVSVLNGKFLKQVYSKIDVEQWVPKIVSSEAQQDINDIVSCGDINPLDWYKYGDIVDKENTQVKEQQVIVDSPNEASATTTTKSDKKDGKADGKDDGKGDGKGDGKRDGKEPVENSAKDKPIKSHKKSVVVGDKTFVASSSLLEVLDCIKSVLILSINLPIKHLNNLEKTLISILVNYNSYNLSKITTLNNMTGERKFKEPNKNYSILSESLECLKEMIPHIERFYIRLSNNSNISGTATKTLQNPATSTSTSSSTSSLSSSSSSARSLKYKEIIQTYNKTSTMIYTSNIPPPMD